MTITDPAIIRTILENDGYHRGDPQAYCIYNYNIDSFAVFMNPETVDIFDSPYVTFPVLFWSREGGLTPEAKEWLNERQ